MNRKNFIRNTALGVTGILYSPEWMIKNNVILGQGNKKFRLNTNWSRADVARYPVKDCHEMIQDRKGRILLLTNETKNNVIIYDKSGKFLSAWGTEYPGAHGLTLFDENGTDVLFICDNARHQVIKTTIDGKVLLVLDYPRETGAYTKPEEYIPTETTIAPNGDIYVVDGYGRDYVIQYDQKGRYIRHFGGRGNGPQHLLNAHGICIDHRHKKPVLIVTSRKQNAFKRYTMDGVYMDTVAMPGAWVCRPVIKGEHLYAAVLQSNRKQDQQSGFVTILDKNNRVISNLAGCAPQYADGKLQELYQTDPVFRYPHDVCVDDEENLYVAQWNSGKVYPYKLEPVV
ncbi:6-bladed beta-propeller [Niabella aurantiaca]|uniref:6-bladed beta-propeller n=1 Tax=Niabella aurantiaca TaxID=379900 RepID=UPI000379BFBC|nr:6-bladed beta-propeller [Niabella aurantiaca]